MLLIVKDMFQGVGLMDFYRNDIHITRDSKFLNTIDIKRKKDCALIRDQISVTITRHLNLKEKNNWNAPAIHNVKTCTCDRGGFGRKKEKEANKKRRKFHKTEKGIAIKKMYQEKIEEKLKKRLLRQLSAMDVRKNVKNRYLTARNL